MLEVSVSLLILLNFRYEKSIESIHIQLNFLFWQDVIFARFTV